VERGSEGKKGKREGQGKERNQPRQKLVSTMERVREKERGDTRLQRLPLPHTVQQLIPNNLRRRSLIINSRQQSQPNRPQSIPDANRRLVLSRPANDDAREENEDGGGDELRDDENSRADGRVTSDDLEEGGEVVQLDEDCGA
jgi:hypothetical protein